MHIYAIRYSPDEKFIYSSGSLDNGVGKSLLQKWTTSTFELLKEHEIPNNGGNSLALSKDGKIIITGSGVFRKRDSDDLYLWDATSFKCINHFKGHESTINSIAYSPDNNSWATGSSDRTFKLWKNNKCVKTFDGENSAIEFVSFSPDGKYLATGSSDGYNKIWHTESGVCIFSRKTKYEARSLVFGDNCVFYYGGQGGICVFPFPNLQNLIDESIEFFKARKLTLYEKKKYYLE